jgi:stage V sporulation protein G
MNDGTYRDIAHAITYDFRTKLERTVLKKYKEELIDPDPDLKMIEKELYDSSFGPSKSEIEITEVTISLRDEDKLKAFANVTFNSCFVVRGLKVIKSSSGYFVSMPSRKMNDGTYRDIAHPITHDFISTLEHIVLEKYKEESIKSGIDLDFKFGT